jgi:O-acetyl-ADP-ribose deacetylase (regulator of RNase III)
MITRYIQGDITETELTHIAQGVNCQNTMGSGVAKALYTKWPEVKVEYHGFCGTTPPQMLLGQTHRVVTVDWKVIWNCFTQLEYGYDGKKYVNYAAVSKVMTHLSNTIIGSQLAIPKIGCGLAGGNWTFMEQLINDTVTDKIEIWVYDNSQVRSSNKNDLA